jgi:TPR repeat protein
MLELGLGGPKDAERALKLYEHACEDDDPTGCNNLGSAFRDGKGRPPDLDRARALYSKSCEGDYPPGCSNLGALFRDGQGVSRDPRQAERHFQQGCRSTTELGRLGACMRLAELVVDNHSTAFDLATARDHASRACEQQDRDGCLVLGKYYWKREPDLERAKTSFQRACELGSKGGCAGVKVLGAGN